MKQNELLFLGTGAGDWINGDGIRYLPHRLCSSVLINKEILIDCGPHVFASANELGDENLYSDLKHVLITHRHVDHFNADNLEKLAASKKLDVACDNEITSYTYDGKPTGGNKNTVYFVKNTDNISFVSLPMFKKAQLGDYEIIALPANHDVRGGGRNASHFIIITPDKKELFYGLDGAWFSNDEWMVMKKHKFDVMVLDCTLGNANDHRMFEHNNIDMARAIAAEIRRQDLLNPDGVIIGSHFARTLNRSQTITKQTLKRFDVIAAEEGMRIAF